MTGLLRLGVGTATGLITTNRNSKRMPVAPGFKDFECLCNTGIADLTLALAKLLWLRTIPARPGISQMVCELSKSDIP